MAIYSDDVQLAKGAARRGESATRKVRSRAVLFMAVALCAGLSAAYLITSFLQKRAVKAVRIPLVRVAVAGIDLPIATTVRPDLITTIDWPVDSVPPGAFQDPKALEGRVTASAMTRGELFTEGRLAAPGSGQGMAAVVPSSMRIMAVKVNDVSGLYGWLHPGDFVDVITTMSINLHGGESIYKSKIVLQNVQVKAVGEELVTQNAKPVKVPVVMLLVTPEQSERLALASSKGDLQLTMRSGVDHAEVPTPGLTPNELLAPGAAPSMTVAQAAPAPSSGGHHRGSHVAQAPTPVTAAPPPPKKEGDVVQILRGDRFEERKMRTGEVQ